MTPQNALSANGNPNMASGNPNQLYRSISSQGVPQDNSLEQSNKQNEQSSPAEQFIQRFGSVFTPFQSLLESYPQAATQAEDVKKALSNWMSAVNAQLSQQPQGGGESPL